MTYLYIIPGVGYAHISGFSELDQARVLAKQFCAMHQAEFMEHNLSAVGEQFQAYTPNLSAQEKALIYLKTSTVDKMSAYISVRMYNTLVQTRLKSVYEILINYNAFRNGIYQNFGQKSIHELVTVLYNLFGVIVPKDYFYKGHEKIEVSADNVLAFFPEKDKFK